MNYYFLNQGQYGKGISLGYLMGYPAPPRDPVGLLFRAFPQMEAVNAVSEVT